MSRFDDILQLPGLPAPKLIEDLSFETLLDRQMAEYKRLWPEFADETEFEPVRAHLGVDAYVENLLRQRINEAAAASRLATATGKDLDIIGASRRRNIPRLVLDPGDPDATPLIAPTYEDDEAYRARIQLGPESYSVAGPEGAYVFWAMSVAGVADATAVSPAPAEALVTVLAIEGDGAADEGLLVQVAEAVTDKTRRPIGDRVTIEAATILSHTLRVTLSIPAGPSPELVLVEAQARLAAYLAERRGIGRSLPVSGLHAALTVSGVLDVALEVDGAPIASVGIVAAAGEAIHISAAEIVTVVQ
ncbi:baseplate assembly protein [Roseibium litorale]|uniref:Baseplate J/gp47 family protein n=1 Tax=Roseibium litorale TaxID=2803841 RepID=A0ABR9CJ96_9HYPH|nr:baseplate J/gp47 family protein [Roseibium litorale]MBD8890897.1 baseplate J/gp47 family protein [Roseibium litorale]